MKTRFAVLPDERRMLLGIDKANLFEAGYVYEATEFLDEIVIKKVGKYALPSKGQYPSEMSDNQGIISSAMHLLTKEEYLSACIHGNPNISLDDWKKGTDIPLEEVEKIYNETLGK